MERRERMEQRREEAEYENENQTFTPDISSSQYNCEAMGGGALRFEVLYRQGEAIRAKKEQLREDVEYEDEECTFAPELYSRQDLAEDSTIPFEERLYQTDHASSLAKAEENEYFREEELDEDFSFQPELISKQLPSDDEKETFEEHGGGTRAGA